MSDPNPFLERPRRTSWRRWRREGLWAAGCAVLGAAGWLAWERFRPSEPAEAGPAPAPPRPASVEPAASSTPSTPAPGVVVKLPADDGPHRNLMEWWYYNGHLEAADGRVFSFHYVYFLVNSVVPYTAAQVSLVDHGSGRRWAHQKSSPGNPSAGTKQGFAFNLGGWEMAGRDGTDLLRAGTADFGFDLALSNPGPTVFHGGSGLLDFREAGSSFYYSRPRMKVEGTLRLDGPVPVKGSAWFDHQWGDFQPLKLGWDWLSLQLDDGSDVMIYLLRDRAQRPVLASGTFARAGATMVLGASDFSLTPLGTWRSPATGITYTTRWRLAIPAWKLDVEITPVIPDCEFDARGSTLMTYWEGAVRISGTHPGRGFQEICPLRPERPKPGG